MTIYTSAQTFVSVRFFNVLNGVLYAHQASAHLYFWVLQRRLPYRLLRTTSGIHLLNISLSLLNSNSHHASYLGLIAHHTCTSFTHTLKSHCVTSPLLCEVLICPGCHFWALLPVFAFVPFDLRLLSRFQVFSACPDSDCLLDSDSSHLPWFTAWLLTLSQPCLHCPVCWYLLCLFDHSQ